MEDLPSALRSKALLEITIDVEIMNAHSPGESVFAEMVGLAGGDQELHRSCQQNYSRAGPAKPSRTYGSEPIRFVCCTIHDRHSRGPDRATVLDRC